MTPNILISSGSIFNQNGQKEYLLKSFYGACLEKLNMSCAMQCCAKASNTARCFDGLILSGGGDLDPWYYGQRAESSRLNINPVRDQEEMELMDEFYIRGKPILGICRGMQIINVYFGGVLFQDIEINPGLYHMEKKHSVITSQNTTMRKLFGRQLTVNSFHHQAAKTVGGVLKVSAVCDDDGIIEAIEHADKMVIGVQWHPERMVPDVCMDTSNSMESLFQHCFCDAD